MAAPRPVPPPRPATESTSEGVTAPSRSAKFLVGAASITFSLATTALLLKPARGSDGSTLFGDFRGFFAFDQLSYAAIATTAATGNLSRVEPFTESGVSYYPSLWYQILGLASRYLGIGVPAAWTVFGVAVVGIAILILGLIAIRISGRAWAAALVGPALWIGPLAMAFTDTWYLPLESHAKLWGPYGLLFPLNAESVGVSLAAISLVIAVWATLGTRSRSLQIGLFSFSAVVLGLIANIHTYAFLIATAFTLAWLAVLGFGLLNRQARRIAVSVSLAIILAVFVAAQVLTEMNGSIFLFGLMALAALPGITPLVLRHGWPTIALGLLFLASASPQLAHLANGIAGADPFLEYRQVQSALLTVPWLPFVVASAPIGAWVATLMLLSKRVAMPAPLGALVWAAAITVLLLTFNGYWGFGQEPYRMWIGCVALTSMILVLPTAWAIANRPPLSGLPLSLIASTTAALILISFSWWNLGGFRQDVRDSGAIAFGSERAQALKVLTSDARGLLASDSCVDAQELKIASRGRVAYYNPGLAWPENKEALDVFLDERASGTLSGASMRDAGIAFLVTSDNCTPIGETDANWGLLMEKQQRYMDRGSEKTLTLWRVLP